MEKVVADQDGIGQEFFNEINLEQIAAAYELPKLKFVNAPSSGLITDNAILEDGSGKRYFAKRYLSDVTEKCYSVYRASEIVAQEPSLSVTVPLVPKEGSYSIIIEDASLVLFDLVDHTDIDPRNIAEAEKLTSNIGETLGKIHAAAIPENEKGLQPIERWLPEARNVRLKKLQEILEIIDSKDELDDFDKLAREVAQVKLEFIKSNDVPPIVEIDPVICHADLHKANVLHDADMNILAICDWDNAGLANPYRDLLTAFYSNVIRSKFDTTEEQLVLARAFVVGYEKGIGKKVDEELLVKTFPSFIEERVSTMWPMFQHYFEDNTKTDHVLKRTARQARELVDVQADILALFRTALT